MNVTLHEGDLLTSGCDIIAHQINRYGVFGGGIAAQIKAMYPKTAKKCRQFVLKTEEEGQEVYKKVFFYYEKGKEKSTIIANCFSQEGLATRQKWVRLCARKVFEVAKAVSFFEKRHVRIGIPYNYGCGIAKGNWEIVESEWRRVAEEYADWDVELEIWRLDK